MRKHAIILAAIALSLLLAACDEKQPPTQIYIVLSPTPDGSQTATAPATVQPTQASTATAQPTSTLPATTPAPTRIVVVTNTPASTPLLTSATNTPASTPLLASATPAPEIFPTNTVAQVQIAEQVFQHGRMFWIRHSRQIWVMQASPDNPNGGDWFCYNDTFEEGEPETDPSLVAPQASVQLYQPRRGFGKLWRSHPELTEGLGWGVTPEFELTSSYTYIPGGYVQNNQYFPGPGEHRLTTLYNEPITFFEAEIRGDCQGGTWRMATAQ
jgi:hypothetical protein